MKIFKVVSLFILLALVSGCTSSNLKGNYNKMQDSKGYILDLRISGINNGNKVNEILRITNYQNKEYQISKTILSEQDKKIDTTNETMYIKDKKLYVSNEDGVYTKSDITTYTNIPVYLEGLINVSKVKEQIKETIGENKYDLYSVVFKKEAINNILKDTVLNKIKVTKDVDGKIYIDSNKYVYRITYNLDNITIIATYFNVDKVNPINYPNL